MSVPAASAPWFTAGSSPAAGSTGSLDDPARPGAADLRDGFSVRCGSGDLLRLSGRSPAEKLHCGRPGVSGRSGLVPGAAGLPPVRRGPAARLSGGAGSGLLHGPQNAGKPSGPIFWNILAYFGRELWIPAVPAEKNFQIRKKYVCIWGKMGYNKMECPGACQAQSWRWNP